MATGRIVRKMIDIGANLTDPMFRGQYNSKQKHRDDFDDMLRRSFNSGIEKMIITGGSLSDSKAALDLAMKHENLFTTVGCHPTRCNEFEQYSGGPDAYLSQLSELIKDKKSKVVAVGELGLDYDRLQFCSKDIQKEYFKKQLDLAYQTKLPLFLHNRNSIDDLCEILSGNRDKFIQFGGVVHSFDGTRCDVRRLLELNLHIGINGNSLKTQDNLDVIEFIPSDRLVIDTDCPWCEIKRTHASFKYVKTHFDKTKDASDPNLPVKNRNEPMNLVQILEVLAAVREEDIESLSEQIYTNTNDLFFNK